MHFGLTLFPIIQFSGYDCSVLEIYIISSGVAGYREFKMVPFQCLHVYCVLCKHAEDQHVFLPHKIDLQIIATEATKDLLWELNTLRKRK